MFGWAKPVPVDVLALRNPRRGMMLVAAAGPAMNFALAWIAGLLVHPVERCRRICSPPNSLAWSIASCVSASWRIWCSDCSTCCRSRRSMAAVSWPGCCRAAGAAVYAAGALGPAHGYRRRLPAAAADRRLGPGRLGAAQRGRRRPSSFVLLLASATGPGMSDRRRRPGAASAAGGLRGAARPAAGTGAGAEGRPRNASPSCAWWTSSSRCWSRRGGCGWNWPPIGW